ncbi:MAG: enoyl-CoA hydratase [Syntrophobacterales bacterium CG_4_8_14_3_um_filter_58_8]|nr:MAG: enoyl-CoA hydratase [Syntrophobacterales bacterium CG_4_8_14_3_um_filter_58_8]
MNQYADGKMLAEVNDGIGRITFNQPEKHNAMSIKMWLGLDQILDMFADSGDVRVVVLEGAGHKAFVSGADISQFGQQRANAQAQKEYEKLTNAGRAKLASFRKPVLASIRGFCLGGGLGIAMQADLRIAATNSQFGIPAARIGIAYGFDMVRKLVSIVGPAHARMLLYTGQRIDSAAAERIGLINKVVPDNELLDTVAELSKTIANNAPLSLWASKLAVSEATKSYSERNMEAVQKAVAACFDSTDYYEGRTAFMEKRTPRFQGR